MVDPKTTELTVETETGARVRKVWISPRLETSFISEDTESGNTGPGPDTGGGGGGPGTCLS